MSTFAPAIGMRRELRDDLCEGRKTFEGLSCRYSPGGIKGKPSHAANNDRGISPSLVLNPVAVERAYRDLAEVSTNERAPKAEAFLGQRFVPGQLADAVEHSKTFESPVELFVCGLRDRLAQ